MEYSGTRAAASAEPPGSVAQAISLGHCSRRPLDDAASEQLQALPRHHMHPASDDVTQLLVEAAAGDATALDRLLPVVYPQLQALARKHLRGERSDHTLDTIALASEAYLRLAGQPDGSWANRDHFFAVAGMAMRRILVSYARARSAEKRGGGERSITLIEGSIERETRTDELLALDEALTRFAQVSPRGARVVELWFFGGLTQAEIGRALSISEATVRRDWRVARAYLTQSLNDDTFDTAIAPG